MYVKFYLLYTSSDKKKEQSRAHVRRARHDAHAVEVEKFPDFDQGTINRISRLVARVRAWGSSISRMYDYEKWEKKAR